MSSFNKVILLGNITRDPELKYLPKGTAVCQFGLAVNRKWKDQAGELKEEVTFCELQAWGNTAENISKYFRKGSPIFIEGRLSQETWEDKATGQKRSKTRIVVETFQFIGGKRDDSAQPQPPKPIGKPAPEASEPEDDDVPF